MRILNLGNFFMQFVALVHSVIGDSTTFAVFFNIDKRNKKARVKQLVFGSLRQAREMLLLYHI